MIFSLYNQERIYFLRQVNRREILLFPENPRQEEGNKHILQHGL
jgi:hypothetical protein